MYVCLRVCKCACVWPLITPVTVHECFSFLFQISKNYVNLQKLFQRETYLYLMFILRKVLFYHLYHRTWPCTYLKKLPYAFGLNFKHLQLCAPSALWKDWYRFIIVNKSILSSVNLHGTNFYFIKTVGKEELYYTCLCMIFFVTLIFKKKLFV